MAVHYVTVDGLALPAPLSGHASLDFCNTRTGWNGGEVKEYLERYEHLVVWAGFSGLLSPDRVAALARRARRDRRSAAAVLDQTKEVRGRLYQVLLDPLNTPAFDLFARDVARATDHLRLHRADGAVGFGLGPAAGLAAPLLAAVWSAADLLRDERRPPVRACPGRECGWLFLDRSGRRRWCTMATCGNREKARRFARRQDGKST